MRKTKINKGLLAMAVFASGFLSSANVFAANPYNINYSGGEPLGAENVTINAPLINSLTPLIAKEDGSNLTFSTSNKWEEVDGYVQWGGNKCDPIRYIRIWDEERISGTDNISYSITGDKYVSHVKIKSIVPEGLSTLSENGDNLIVGVNKSNGWLFVGFNIYPDNQCTEGTELEGITNLKSDEETRVFVETEITLNKKGESEPFVSNELYFGITDIDQAQSYKILNEGSKLTKSNMFTVSAESLQPTDSELKNMFVESGNYIYSEYDGLSVNNVDDSNVLVKIDTASQAEGLDVVYGFAKQAGSGLDYFAKQYVVNYKSDKNGEITGIKKEDVVAGQNPTGSTEKPSKGYVLQYWTADVDVTIDDGIVIKAGKKITAAQIKKVVVSSNITFTAIHGAEKEVAAPDTGTMTEEDVNNTFIMGLVFPIGMLAAMAGTYIVNRKKHTVSFKK